MKKKLLALSSMLFISSCATNDIISEQNESKISQSSEKNLIQSKSNSLTSKTGVVMDLTFLDKVQPDHGGCSVTNIDGQGNPHTSQQAFGPNPISYFGYLITGYGKPRMYWGNWNGLRFETGNRSKTIINNGQQTTANDPLSNAISIQFPFQANLTYEITIETGIHDEIYRANHNELYGDDDLYSVNQSEAFPTVAVELANSQQISGNDPCSGRPTIGNFFVSRYYKKQKIEMTTSPASESKTFVFKFSITEAQNALKIYFLPELSGTSSHIPESNFTMYIGNIKIVQKPFEQTFEPNIPFDPTRPPVCSRCPK